MFYFFNGISCQLSKYVIEIERACILFIFFLPGPFNTSYGFFITSVMKDNKIVSMLLKLENLSHLKWLKEKVDKLILALYAH